MEKLTIQDIELKGKNVLIRVDYNVPVEKGSVISDVRIRASLPTLEYVLKQGGKPILMSHLGRPKGQRLPEMSLRPCADALGRLMGTNVSFIDDCIGDAVARAIQQLKDGEILLLENLRYYKEETDNDKQFAEKLASLGDLYVNDAFGTAHRAHASTEGVTHFLKPCVAGLLMKKELDYLGRVLENSDRPFVMIIGGAKISDKINVISNMLPRVDMLIIGGGMAFTFLKAQGYEIGDSICEVDKLALAKDLLTTGEGKITLPLDCVVSDSLDMKQRRVGSIKEVKVDAIPHGWIGLDIGSKSIDHFRPILQAAKTIVWNGPMGVFEIEKTATGTYAMATCVAEATRHGATSVIGGGDSASAIQKAGVSDSISHISTGGGASLEFLEGKILPGVAALSDK